MWREALSRLVRSCLQPRSQLIPLSSPTTRPPGARQCRNRPACMSAPALGVSLSSLPPGQHHSLWIPACQTREPPQISQVDTLPRGHWNSAFHNAPTLFITAACITFTSNNTNKNLRVPVQPPVRLQGAGGCWTQVWGLRHSAPDTAKHPTAQPGRGSGMQTWSPNFLF